MKRKDRERVLIKRLCCSLGLCLKVLILCDIWVMKFKFIDGINVKYLFFLFNIKCCYIIFFCYF